MGGFPALVLGAAEEAYKVDPQLFLQTKPFDPETLRALVELALSGSPAPGRRVIGDWEGR